MDYLSLYYKNLAEQLQEKIVILQKEINEVYRRTPARDAILNNEKKKAKLGVYAASEKHLESGINNDSDYDSDYVYAARDFKTALDRLDRINNIINKTVKKVKPVNEASRPTFIPLTTAYDDSGDAEPNVATLRDDEETDLRVDNFGGQYPDAGYAKMDRSRRESENSIQALHNELYYARERAKKSHMNNTTYRGRAVSSYPSYTKVAQQAETDFNQTFVPSVSLTDRFKGLITTRDITQKMLQKHSKHKTFLQAETERAKGIR